MFHDLYADFYVEQLDNGLSLYVKEYPNVSWFYSGMVIHAGAREDPAGRAGLAHLVEHVVGENVQGLTFSQLERRLRELGGYGWFGETSYFASEYKCHLPNEEKSIQGALELFGQMLVQPKALTQQIEEEKAIILREYHQYYDHEFSRAWSLEGRPFLFETHPCLQSFHSALGVPEGFLESTQKDIQAFYDTYYIPANISMICLGALPRHRLLSLIERTPFSVQRAGQRNSMPTPFFPQPPQKQEQSIHLATFSHFREWEAEISYEWVLPLSFERWCVQLFCHLFEERLTEELRYLLHLTYSVTVSYAYYQDCRTIRVCFQTAPDTVERTRALFWQVLRSLDQDEGRYRETKQGAFASLSRMDFSGYRLLESAMNDLAGYQRLISFSEELRHIEQTTFDQLVELAHYLTEERHFCFIVLP